MPEEEQDHKSKWTPRVKPIVLDETGVSKYSIYDVVLPLPGYDVIYPSNEGMLRVMVCERAMGDVCVCVLSLIHI